MSEVRLVMTTFGSESEAKTVVRELLERKLIACVNLIPQAVSLYRWEGKVCEEAEVVVFLKTVTTHYSALEAALQELHSYDVPEIVALELTAGSERYFNFVRENTDLLQS